MITFFSFQLTWIDILAVSGVAILVGMSKTGVHGAGMMAVPLLAAVFGGQASTGLMLPALCLADVIGVWYYHRHASWYHLRKLLPGAAVGIIAGVVVGGRIDDEVFKTIMGTVILSSIVLMIWLERGHKGDVPDTKLFSSVMGIIAGFTSMVGNLAGSITAVYFLSMRLPKNSFIGTTAWFFLLINFFKVPFHVFGWHTISLQSFGLNLLMFPAILLGAFIGIYMVKNLEEKTYRWFIISMTVIAALMMMF